MRERELMEFVPNVEFMLVPCSSLCSNVAYQRDCSAKFVNRVSNDFDKNLLKVVRCSERDGKLWVWDGQHTVEIVKKAAGTEDALVWCMIYKGLTYEEEADLFSRQQQYEKSLMAYNITNAKLEARDPDTLMMENILSAYGFSFSVKIGDYKIRATGIIEKIFYKYGAECLSRVLQLISDTWDGKREYIRSAFLSAMAKFVDTYGKEFDDDSFTSRMMAVSMDEIIRESKSFAYGKRDYFRSLISFYNKRGGKRLRINI